MALAPLRAGPHTVRADRLAFATPVPVREASAAGHWITLHAADSDEGTVHVYVGGGGYIEKGPGPLVHQHIGQLASHPSVARTTRHPAGHEPEGARSHPQFIEGGPKPRPGTAAASTEGGEGEPAKAPGKPYARLSGVEQGRRTEQVGKALSEAQNRAAARLARDRREPPRSPEHAAERAASDDRDRAEAAHFHAAGTFDRSGNARGGTRATRDAIRATRTQHEAAGHRLAIAESKAEVERLRQKAEARAPQKSPQEKLAETAVAHQRAQVMLAAHRSAHDRNPNPWAPHLSPPVGDAKDRELAEKATRAQLAHQAAQAQQQGAQQQQQTEGQRAHEKEMMRLKAETAQPKPAFSAPRPKAQEKPQAAAQPEQRVPERSAQQKAVQGEGAAEPSPEHRDALREGRKLLGQKALDPATHKAKVEAAVHRAASSDPFEGAQRGYARHGDEYALRLAHLEAAGHYQNHANVLQRQHLALTNQDKGGVLAKAQRHIETLTHHEQRAQAQTHPESEQQARDLLDRSQAISRHYTSGVQHLNAKVQEHRDAHKRLTGAYSWVARESAAPAPRFSAPVAPAR